MSDPGDDAALLARLRSQEKGDRRRAERELFERFHGQVERVLHRLLGADTEDCVQEAFVDVFRGLPAFEGRARLSTWVYRIVLRRGWKCLAERRRQERPADTEPIEDLEAPTAADPLEATELAVHFERALARLDLDQRTALALSAVDGLGPAEIAEVLGAPVGTVHSRLHRARERMREYLGVDE